MDEGNDILNFNTISEYFFYGEKEKRINEIKTILMYINKLSEHGYEDEKILKVIDDIESYYSNKLSVLKRASLISQMKELDRCKDYIPTNLKYYCVTKLNFEYEPILKPFKIGFNGKFLNLYSVVNNGDFLLCNEESFENVKKFFSLYISLRQELDEDVLRVRNDCFALYKGKVCAIDESIKKYKSYKRFNSVYSKIMEEKLKKITDYIYLDEFPKNTLEYNYKVLDSHLDDLKSELNIEIVQNIKVVDYMDQRMLRLCNIKPKNMTSGEENLFHRMHLIYDKNEFDNEYAALYTMFTEHIYNDEKIKKNLKTKKSLKSIKRKVDAIYKLSIAHLIEAHQVQQKNTRDYLYNLLQRVIDDNSISLDQKVLSELTLYDFREDFRVINESINGGVTVPENNVYIPRLDNKTFDRRFLYNLAELTFDYPKIKVNQLSNNLAQEGEVHIDYEPFIYQYMSLDTYIENADYIGKDFIVNDFHKEDSQDFSNSILVFNYNGILLIDTLGEYEVVSHETITKAGYDIPVPDKLKANKIEWIKDEMSDAIIEIAESLRDERSSLNMVNPFKPISVRY